MTVLLKSALTLIIVIGLLVYAWNFKAADDGDKKAKKRRNIGIGMFLIGEVVGFFWYFLRFL